MNELLQWPSYSLCSWPGRKLSTNKTLFGTPDAIGNCWCTLQIRMTHMLQCHRHLWMKIPMELVSSFKPLFMVYLIIKHSLQRKRLDYKFLLLCEPSSTWALGTFSCYVYSTSGTFRLLWITSCQKEHTLDLFRTSPCTFLENTNHYRTLCRHMTCIMIGKMCTNGEWGSHEYVPCCNLLKQNRIHECTINSVGRYTTVYRPW